MVLHVLRSMPRSTSPPDTAHDRQTSHRRITGIGQPDVILCNVIALSLCSRSSESGFFETLPAVQSAESRDCVGGIMHKCAPTAAVRTDYWVAQTS